MSSFSVHSCLKSGFIFISVVAIFTTLGVAMARAGLMALEVAQGAGNGITRTSRANLEAYS